MINVSGTDIKDFAMTDGKDLYIAIEYPVNTYLRCKKSEVKNLYSRV